MRWSQLHVPTLRQDPADAEAASHRLLVRAGLIRQLPAGHYALLPLAVRVRAKIMAVLRQEMDRIGGQECLLPAMAPADPGGPDPGGPEAVTALALELRSYRDLPQRWYQFQTRIRDGPRPRGGLLRARQLTMHDSWSFDLDAEGLDRSFDLHRRAYAASLERLGIPAVAVAASGGQRGGTTSVQLMCLSEAGGDLVLRCPACGYAATADTATAALAPVADGAGPPAPEPFPTPGARTIEDLARAFGAPADRQVKTLVYVVDGRPTLVLLRGDHSLAGQKLVDATGAASLRPAEPDEVREALGASPGSVGAVGVAGLPVLADRALAGRRDMVTGANVDDRHLRGVDVERDIRVDRWADLRQVTAGEPCPVCRRALEGLPAIEVGHLAKLGDRHSRALGLSVLGPDGRAVTPVLGSYGIGVERALAAIVEAHHDEAGIVWPVAVAPFAVAVVALDPADPAVMAAAGGIADRLAAGGADALVDDRDERPGVKFRDAELIGFPFRVTVGARDLARGTVEVARRATGERQPVAVEAAPGHLLELLTVASPG